ncbi:ATP synthase subunit I [Beggiatoa leptomitoformis]|uniref:ATP synthase subunit I n=1 Tax=Beggiatoa leptomitoformis TaxID=288004 RepID=A0A2N9YHC4_9GAMM|nr:ATP synthase subunit I [Beggiatoa leptomitoformis]ALG67845.1 ATP synthase subunit I [Beggiatoa leptomitoformis]AUI69897.1 ATP synthase subunit I [Beggiatoa leptomitoformis]
MNEQVSSIHPPLSDTGARKVLRVQTLLISGITLVFYFGFGQAEALAALYGGFIVLFNVWITHRRLQTALELAKVAPGKEVVALYAGAIQRFVATLIFFGLGMGWLQLSPVPMLVTFAVAQIGYAVGHVIRSKPIS